MQLTIYNKSSITKLSEVKTGYVDLIITSPPYWNLKDYDNNEQLGKGVTYKQFFELLKSNMFECMRVLKEDGFVIFIVADVRTKAGYGGSDKHLRPLIFSLQSDIIQYFNSMDFELFTHIIWKKTSVKKGDKGKIIYGSVTKEYVYPPYVYSDMSMEHIIVFRKPGEKRKLGLLKNRTSDRLLKEDVKNWFNPIWEIEPAKHLKHPAVFPPELANRLIQLYSLKNDVILDPFCGVGTTLSEAIQLERNAIGYELNYEYIEEIIKKFNLQQDGIKYYNQDQVTT